MKDQEPDLMTDADLDRLLMAASQPRVPMGAQERLMQRVAAVDGRGAAPRSRPWIVALPFAASLVLGIYLGIAGYGPGLLSASEDVWTAADFGTGLEEAELVAEDEPS